MLELLQPWAILVPAFVAGSVLFLSWQAWRRDGAGTTGYWGGAVGLALGYFVGHSMMAGKLPAAPPHDAINDWIPYVGAVAMLYGLLEAFTKIPLAFLYLLRAVIITTTLWFLLNPLMQGAWSLREGIQWIIGLGLGWLLFWSVMEPLAGRAKGMAFPIVFWALASGSAFTLLFSDSALLGKLSGVVAGLLGAVIVITLMHRSVSLARGGFAVLTCLLWTLWVDGFAYANLPIGRLVLLAFAPVLLWVGPLKQVQGLRPWQRFVIQAGLPLILIAYVVYQSYLGYEPMESYD